MKRHGIWTFAIAATLLCVGAITAVVRGDIAPGERDELEAVSSTLADGLALYREGKIDAAAGEITKADEKLKKLAAEAKSDDLKRAIERLSRRLAISKRLVIFKGGTIEGETPAKPAEPEVPIAKPETKPETKPEPKPETKPEPKPEPKTVASIPVKKPEPKPEPKTTKPVTPVATVSFVRDVAPMLFGKCVRCHSDGNAKQGFSVTSFAAIMKGSDAGRVISDKDGAGSRITQLIDEGDMPRGGGKVSQQERDALVKWIDEGAQFDGGPDQNVPLNQLKAVPLPKPATPVKPVAKPTTKPTVNLPSATDSNVSFGAEVAPILIANCMGCHGTTQPRAMLSFKDYASVLKGGDGGVLFTAGKGADSLLVKRLRGQGGQRMPMGADPLPDLVIAKIEKWINEGAKFDGPGQTLALEQVAKIVGAVKLSPEQLSAQRIANAIKSWRTAIPDGDVNQHETNNFVVIGSQNETQLEEFGLQAETTLKIAKAKFGIPSDKPLIKGRITIFMFQKPYDYTEFGTMVEKRELPKGIRGHWKYDLSNAYACISPVGADKDSFESLLGEALGGIYLESTGDFPKWFLMGAARAMGARVNSKSEVYSEWEKAKHEAAATNPSIELFTEGEPKTAEAQALCYGFCKFLAGQNGYSSLMSRVQVKKESFAKAFTDIFKNAQELPGQFLKSASR